MTRIAGCFKYTLICSYYLVCPPNPISAVPINLSCDPISLSHRRTHVSIKSRSEPSITTLKCECIIDCASKLFTYNSPLLGSMLTLSFVANVKILKMIAITQCKGNFAMVIGDHLKMNFPVGMCESA